MRVHVDIPELLPDLCEFLEGRGYEVLDRGDDEITVGVPEGPRDFRAAVTLLADLDVWQAKRSWAHARLDPATTASEDGLLRLLNCVRRFDS